jgi:CDP-glycerol glycerophosphotransferase (TagB/SpsB family)
VVKPHPVMTEPIVGGSFDNVIEIRDLETNDLMITSDLMITDYSSTFFEYALLKKPMAFFCYDYEEYDRDFYIDFDTELPGEILRTQDELFAYLRQQEHPILENYDSFYEKYMGACDGHSTERTVELIKAMLNK